MNGRTGLKIGLLSLLASVVVLGCQNTPPERREDFGFFDSRNSDPVFQAMKAAVTHESERRSTLGISGPLRAHELSKLAVESAATGYKEEGLEHLRRARFYDPTNEDVAKSEQFLAAHVELDKALALQRQQEELNRRDEEAQALMAQGRTLEQQGKWYAAYHKLHAASQLAPWNETVREREQSYRRPAARDLLARASVQMKKEQMLEAFGSLSVAMKLDSELPELAQTHKDIGEGVARRLQEAGRRAEKGSQMALAALRYGQAQEIAPQLPGIDTDVERTEQTQAEKLRYIVIASQESSENGSSASRIRSAFKQAARDLEANPQFQVLTPTAFRELGPAGRKAPHGRLMGTLESLNVSDSETVVTAIKEELYYEAELQRISVHSPESLLSYYPDQLNFGYGRYRGILREMERRANDGDTGNDIMPVFVRVPKTQTITYPVTQYDRHATANFVVRLIDAKAGVELARTTAIGSAAASDTPDEGGRARLPAPGTLKQQAADDLIGRLPYVVRQVAAAHARRFLLQAERARAAGNTKRALDLELLYARSMVSVGAPIDPEIAERLLQTTGYSFTAKKTDPLKLAGGLK